MHNSGNLRRFVQIDINLVLHSKKTTSIEDTSPADSDYFEEKNTRGRHYCRFISGNSSLIDKVFSFTFNSSIGKYLYHCSNS